jgi:hypothetical protein
MPPGPHGRAPRRRTHAAAPHPDLKRRADQTVGELKAEVARLWGVPAPRQKLMFRGLVKDDGATLGQARDLARAIARLPLFCDARARGRPPPSARARPSFATLPYPTLPYRPFHYNRRPPPSTFHRQVGIKDGAKVLLIGSRWGPAPPASRPPPTPMRGPPRRAPLCRRAAARANKPAPRPCSEADVAAAAAKPGGAPGGPAAWDAPPEKEEPICRQPQHQKARPGPGGGPPAPLPRRAAPRGRGHVRSAARPPHTRTHAHTHKHTGSPRIRPPLLPRAQILAKGRPEDGLPGISGRQVPLAEGQNVIPGLLNSQGSKARRGPRWSRGGGGVRCRLLGVHASACALGA